MTIRLIPPNGAATTSTVNGRKYSAAAGSTLDVALDADALSLTAQGWIPSGTTVCASSARPSVAAVGQQVLDSTLGVLIICTGHTANGAPIWNHHASGSSV
jgi:hypothetical protein